MKALPPVRALLASASACVAAMALVACGGEHVCTLVGGLDGVGVEIPASLYVPSGKVVVEVCDDHCSTATQVLSKLPGSPGPTGRGAAASFHALGRTFEPGDRV